MPQNHPACIPPPADYTPGSRNNHSGGKFGDRGGSRSGRGNRSRHQSNQGRPSFQPNESAEIDSLRPKPNSIKDKFHRNEDDDYFATAFEQDEEEPQDFDGKSADLHVHNEEEEDDPLDAYMKSLEGAQPSESCEEKEKSSTVQEPTIETTDPNSSQIDRGIRIDIDDTDDVEESYYQYVEQTRGKKSIDSDANEEFDDKQDLVEYDRDGNILSIRRSKKEIDPLPTIDHSGINYESFEKNFYRQHLEIEKLTDQQSDELRAKLDIRVSGKTIPRPVCSFAHFNFDEQLMKVIRRSDYTQPTPIQAQAIPAALMGRNIIGIAQTGSGKTAAYLWPMIVHIMGQPNLKQGEGPIGLILVPTRELALQVYGQAKKFSNSYNIAVVCAYGGGSKYEQSKDLEEGAEVIVATPGRLIDLIKMGVTNLRRVTYLVLDEADRFFNLGFEVQVRSICDHIRPDRQTLLFSATFKKKIEQLARTVTDDPIKIVQKALGEVNEDVTQHVVTLAEGSEKWGWLISKLVEFTSAGSVLIFVTRIANSEELHKNLVEQGKDALLLHGDMEQSERNRVITSFKKKDKDIMVATDVAARGLDISHIRTVINFDVARDIDTHIHRIGRTGRAGTKGDAYTLITLKEKDFAGNLVKNLESSNQTVSDELMKIAMQSHTFRKSRAPPNRHHSSSDSYHKQPHSHHAYQKNHNNHRGGSYQHRHLHSRTDPQKWQDYQRGKRPKNEFRSHNDHQHHNHQNQIRDDRLSPQPGASASERGFDYRKRPRWQ